MCGILGGMGRKTSVWLDDDLAERVRESGVPMAELIRRGLGAAAPDPLEVRLAAVIRAEFEARFRPGIPVTETAPVKRPREKPARRGTDVEAGLVTVSQKALSSDQGLPAGVNKVNSEPSAVVSPSLRRASDLPVPPKCSHPGVRMNGGWCPKCMADVKPGGKLPPDWVMPEGWSSS
jgi:hypothetical protein